MFMRTSEQLEQGEFNFDFITPRRIGLAAVFSIALILISFVSFFVRGLNWGIDFSGGTLVEIGYNQEVNLDKVRHALHQNGYADAVVQYFGSSQDVLIRLGIRDEASKKNLSNDILAVLKKDGSDLSLRRVEFVGPQVGGELIEDGGLALLFTLIGILIYVAFRFEYRFATGAVLALVHDTFITIGVFSLFQIEFDLTVLAALLAVIGYSLNDTIVVFDRIRDNFLKLRKTEPREVMNCSINQTLMRTLMTSFATMLAVLALFFLGGELIHGFSTALVVGIVVGTYSSIYIASTITLKMGISKTDLMPVVKEGAETEQDLP